MRVVERPKEYLLFNAFLVFFAVHTNQVGVGMAGFQRIIFEEAKHDAWVSVIISVVVVHIITYLIIKTLEIYESTDLYGVHHDVYGKHLGRIMSCIYIFYLMTAISIILRTYTEIVQTWVFPDIPNYLIAFFILFLVLYGVRGGIRAVVGVCFLSFILTFWMLLFSYYPLQFAEWNQILPILESDLKSLIRGAYKMSFTIVGFEIIYFIYPFVKEKDKVQKYAHLGLLLTAIVYVGVMIVSLVYFSQGQMMSVIFGTITMFKIIQLPFIERFEYLAVSIWMLIILPNLLLIVWAITRGFKRMFNFKQKNTLYILLPIILVGNLFLGTRVEINEMTDLTGKFGLALTVIYPVILFMMVIIKKKYFAQKSKKES
ncbi:GerAB/ArcD/ProY family transporter [Caldalkalibacillus salinus]|uniref:GerAB/ArcD/ProY family transporter n=1 Tax=Caldalkalibacillus salinus TaxID=2803787 RepID=UPI001920FA05|nr:GerAB/ArcD/ProY family transporter [Caldalkalibacillus salinus]